MLLLRSTACFTLRIPNIRLPHGNGIGPELVFSCATFVLMEQWYPWTYFEAPVMRC